jgi:transcriptional antiterminator RfaH
MPILAAEPEIYPSTLWQEDRSRSAPDRWWCLHTKPRREKALARSLRKQDIAYFLPQVISESRTPGGRTIRSQLPLFPGYIFLHGDDYQLVEATQCNHVANILKVEDQETLERDLSHLHRFLSSGLPISPEPTHPVGSMVEIQTGPLKGFVGTVERRDGRTRFTAIVRFLGKGASVQLEDWQVQTYLGRNKANGAASAVENRERARGACQLR